MVNDNTVSHKVAVTVECICDYATAFDYEKEFDDIFENQLKEKWQLKFFPKEDIVNEIEEWFRLSQAKTYYFGDYIKLKYYDELHNAMLRLFIKRGRTYGIEQVWNIVGICKDSDYDEIDEENGLLRNWYNTKIDDISNEPDWVVV